jgi:flagellar basal body-associated protein FliL
MIQENFTYSYNAANIHAFSYVPSLDNLTIPLIVIGVLFLYVGVYFLSPHIYSYTIDRSKKQEKETKRNIIKELIIMKEIQGELEKEIEQALLNITLQ